MLFECNLNYYSACFLFLFADEEKSRVVVSLVSVAVVLVIGLPVWWNTTKVYRVTLPDADIKQLADHNLQVLGISE